MTKLYRQPIEVQTWDGLPVAFRWRRRWYQVGIDIVKGIIRQLGIDENNLKTIL